MGLKNAVFGDKMYKKLKKCIKIHKFLLKFA
nr:MAG TPA: hypothetical protein [Caudoviricetes sp.]